MATEPSTISLRASIRAYACCTWSSCVAISAWYATSIRSIRIISTPATLQRYYKSFFIPKQTWWLLSTRVICSGSLLLNRNLPHARLTTSIDCVSMNVLRYSTLNTAATGSLITKQIWTDTFSGDPVKSGTDLPSTTKVYTASVTFLVSRRHGGIQKTPWFISTLNILPKHMMIIASIGLTIKIPNNQHRKAEQMPTMMLKIQ